MENASKSLIIVAEILIGVLLLTFLVIMFRAAGGFSKTVDDNIEVKKVSEFNVQFTKYLGRNNLTAQDIITIGNAARDYNTSEEAQNAGYKIEVILTGVDSKYKKVQNLEDATTYEFIQKYEANVFTCKDKDITYNKTTGKVNKINLLLNT